MLVRVCNNCDTQLETAHLEGVSMTVYQTPGNFVQINDVDFCSYDCLKRYAKKALKEKELVDYIDD